MADPKPDGKADWWKTFLYGLVGLGVAGYFFWYFVDFESSRETSRKMNAIIAILYNFGGKWLVCIPFAALGLWLCIEGVRLRLKKSDKAE